MVSPEVVARVGGLPLINGDLLSNFAVGDRGIRKTLTEGLNAVEGVRGVPGDPERFCAIVY